MDLLGSYAASDSEEEEELRMPSASASIVVDVAPAVNTAGLTVVQDENGGALVLPLAQTSQYIDPTNRSVYYNPKYEELYAPVAGPVHPTSKDGLARGATNHKLGMVETSHVSSFHFHEQYNTFQSMGYAAEPSGKGLVGDQESIAKNKGVTCIEAPNKRKRDVTAEASGAGAGGETAAVLPADELAVDEQFGVELKNPATDAYILTNSKSPWANRTVVEKLKPEELTEEQKEYAAYRKQKRNERRAARGQPPEEGDEEEERTDKSFFHGKQSEDYKGDSWLVPPKDKKKENDHCYIPKKWIHTWAGHTKGVSAIRFFPGSGHLLLSASMDTKVKIWDVHNSGKCMRTYLGHSKALKDITFSNDGRRFVSCSFDNNIKLWDTETGQVISTFSTGKMAHVVKLHPDDSKQNILLAGCSDKKIVQWDMNTGDIVQEYDQHLGGVNTITFCDENRRFVTTSDDKTIRVWEYGIPVVIKYIADPTMHSMPSVAMHPNNNWIACQSMDNQIVVYSTKERFRVNHKKVFSGHHNAGYACQVGFSPDGRFVLSGDGEGKLWFWDWKSHRVFRSFKAHDKVTIGAVWHPLETSKVATCSWDGTIKYWD